MLRELVLELIGELIYAIYSTIRGWLVNWLIANINTPLGYRIACSIYGPKNKIMDTTPEVKIFNYGNLPAGTYEVHVTGNGATVKPVVRNNVRKRSLKGGNRS